MNKLANYPSLARFAKEMNLKPRKRGRHEILLLTDIIFGDRDIDELIRCNLNDCLTLAYQTNGMTPERKARLAARKNFASYISAVGELRIAAWLVGIGAIILQWDPPARNGKGELLIKLGAFDVFVEVKTFIGDQERTDAAKKVELIAQDIERLRNKLGNFRYNVDLNEAKGTYQSGSIVPLVRGMVKRVQNGEREVREIFRSAGLEATIIIHAPADDAPAWVTGYGGAVDDQSPFRDRLEHSQRPISNIPAIVCFYDFEWNLHYEKGEPWLPSNVLFGTHVTDVTGPAPREYRRTDGIWKPSQSSSLHAVFIYSEKFNKTADSNSYSRMPFVTGYLNPKSDNPIKKELFGSTVNRWVDNDIPYNSYNPRKA